MYAFWEGIGMIGFEAGEKSLLGLRAYRFEALAFGDFNLNPQSLQHFSS